MRTPSKRSVNRPRPVLMLETLEDRRVLSAGGLLSAFHPFAAADAAPAPVASLLPSLVAVPNVALSTVSTTVGDLGGAAPAGPTNTAAVPALQLNLNTDVLFIQTQNLRLDVGLNPIGSDQPLATLAVGGNVSVGSPANSLSSIAPDVNVGVGGSNVLSVNAGTQADAPTGSVLSVQAGAGTADGVTATVNTGAVQKTLDVSTSGPAIGLLATPAINLGNTANVAGANAEATLPAVIPGAASTPTILAAPVVPVAVDGGGGSAVDAAFSVLPVTGVFVADGGATVAPVAPAVDLGGGTDMEIVLAKPDLEASGLTTRFQPYSLDGGVRNLSSVLAHVGPQTGWWNAFWARLSHMAPWLAGLIFAGTAFEIIRRRRAKAIDGPLA